MSNTYQTTHLEQSYKKKRSCMLRLIMVEVLKFYEHTYSFCPKNSLASLERKKKRKSFITLS